MYNARRCHSSIDIGSPVKSIENQEVVKEIFDTLYSTRMPYLFLSTFILTLPITTYSATYSVVDELKVGIFM